MPDSKACYRKLKHYKYQLVQNYTLVTALGREEDLDTRFIALTVAGNLTVKQHYAWDGPERADG